MGERATAARDAMGERGRRAIADAIALVKPKLHGVSHGRPSSRSASAPPCRACQVPKATLAVAIYAVSLSALFGTSALYHRVNWTRPNVRRGCAAWIAR